MFPADVSVFHVEVIVFDQSTPLMQHKVLKYGILIYEGDSHERVRQEVVARYDYFDCQRLHKELRVSSHG